MQGQASEQDFEQQVVQAVKADVQAGLLSAVAFAAPVSVTHPTTGRMVDAICIQVETPTQNPVVAFRAYKKGMCYWSCRSFYDIVQGRKKDPYS